MLMRSKPLFLLLSVLFACFCSRVSPAETKAERDQRMEWFREARFGLFIHWGVYSVPAGEWNGNKNYGEWFLEETKMPVSQYEKYASQFDPAKFNARDWVRLAKEAGMKYIVITSKHHDGFGMFRSDMTDWCIKSTPFQRDPLKELADACKAEGVTLCFYHSIMDWHHPDWGTRRAWNDRASGTPDMDKYVDFMKGQLKELLTRYGPIGILWFDGEWESPWTYERGADLYKYVRELQPSIIVNNRVGKGRVGMSGMDDNKQGVGDYGTPEQEIPATGFGPGIDWESCMTMNGHWGYNKNDQNWKSTATLVRNLIDCASKGGNYLLNVGPTSEGLIPAPSVERLKEIGAWMKVNHESIYGTTASPFKKLPWGRCTTLAHGKNTTLYLHVFDWPTNGSLLVPGLKNKPGKVYLLSDPKHRSLRSRNTPEGVSIAVPAVSPNPLSTTVVLTLKGNPEIEPPVLTQQPDGSLVLPAAEARLHGSQVRYESGERRDNIGFWLSAEDWVDWEFRTVRLGKCKVTAEIAATSASSFQVALDGQTITAMAPATGDYGKFQVVDLGTLAVRTAGIVSLSVRPVVGQWNPINLKSIHLQAVP
jgi:alpha-L-fucosidase